MSVISSPESKTARSKRLMCLRGMVKMSRREFCEKYDLSPGTLQNWEKARFGGLTEKGALRMIEHFKQEGVYCSFKWLMYGEGEEARFVERGGVVSDQPDKSYISRRTSFQSDLSAMQALHPNSVGMSIIDDAMAPLLEKGSYILGNKNYSDDAIKRCVNQVCIVETTDGIKFTRLLKSSHKEGKYNLYVYNALTTAHPATLLEVELQMAAPVFWVRKEDRV